MSHDIYFVRRDPGQSFEDALEETEESFQGDPGPLSEGELEQWAEVLPRAREVLGDVDVYGDDTTRELMHPATGIQLSLFNGEIAIHVPDERPGDGDPDVMGMVYELALAVERTTGLEGYDSALEEPVSHRDGPRPVHRRDPDGWDDDDSSESDGTSTTLPAFRHPREPQLAATAAGGRRWWEIWKA